MKSLSFLVMCLAMAGCCNGQAPPTNSDPAGMMDYTWVVQHSKELDSDQDCTSKICVRPFEYLKLQPIPGSNGEYVLNYGATAAHKLFSFKAEMEQVDRQPIDPKNPDSDQYVRSVQVNFLDDAQGHSKASCKQLTLTMVKLDRLHQGCDTTLNDLAGGKFSRNERIQACGFDHVVYWRITDSNSCKDCDSCDTVQTELHPENGHGTASGGIN